MDQEPSKYERWLAAEGRLSAEVLGARRRAMKHLPLISVMMPVFDPHIPFLRRAIHSVQAQTWDRWELCIVDDASTNPAVRAQLEGIVERDPRVQVRFRTSNGHICHASNDALALCRGDFVALFDHDDLLHPDALHWVAWAITERPEADVVFTDEDKVDEDGRHHSPHLKHQLNLDILWSQNFLSHLGVYRRSLLTQVGGFRPGFEGSQDHDLVLRVLEASAPRKICHVPKVLYHWREAEGSTASAHEAKAYAYDAGRRAVQEHLTRSGRQARVDPTAIGGVYRVCHGPAMPMPQVGLALVGGPRPGLHVESTIELLGSCKKVSAEVVIAAPTGAFDRIDAATQDRYRRHQLHRLDPDRANVARLVNDAVARAGGDVVVLLAPNLRPWRANPWVSPSVAAPAPEAWLVELVKQAMRPEVGVAGGRLVDCHQRVESAGLVLGCSNILGRRDLGASPGAVGYMMRGALVQEVSAVSAGCLAVRRDVWEQLGGLDPRFREAYYDVDFCLRARLAGLAVVYTPWCTLQTAHALEESARVWPAGLAQLIHKHVRTLRADAFLSPHLRLVDGNLIMVGPADRDRAGDASGGEVEGSAPRAERARALGADEPVPPLAARPSDVAADAPAEGSAEAEGADAPRRPVSGAGDLAGGADLGAPAPAASP